MARPLIDLYVYDNLRGDGASVRFARLCMFSPSLIMALCWVMECSFAVAFFRKGRVRTLSILAFWLAYLTINLMIV